MCFCDCMEYNPPMRPYEERVIPGYRPWRIWNWLTAAAAYPRPRGPVLTPAIEGARFQPMPQRIVHIPASGVSQRPYAFPRTTGVDLSGRVVPGSGRL